MNNDTLIDQARHLYAALYIEHTLSIENKTRSDRLDRMIADAYFRYLRRLNRCVMCYQHQFPGCIRELWYKDRKSCTSRIPIPTSTHQ
jgi:hypothetical protein